MDGRIGPWVLWPRALVVGLLVTGFGTTGHVAAGGLLPGTTAMSFLTASTVALAAPLLLRQASTTRLVLMLLTGQAAVHLGLTAAAGGAGHHHEAVPGAATSGADPTGASLVDILTSHVVGHGPMMAAHLTAAAVVGLWLASGEQALWTLIRVCGHRLGVLLTLDSTPVIGRPSRRPTTHQYPRVRVALWQSLPDARRGPPLPT